MRHEAEAKAETATPLHSALLCVLLSVIPFRSLIFIHLPVESDRKKKSSSHNISNIAHARYKHEYNYLSICPRLLLLLLLIPLAWKNIGNTSTLDQLVFNFRLL